MLKKSYKILKILLAAILGHNWQINRGRNIFIGLMGPINAGKILKNIENILGIKMVPVHGHFRFRDQMWLWNVLMNSHKCPKAAGTAPALACSPEWQVHIATLIDSAKWLVSWSNLNQIE